MYVRNERTYVRTLRAHVKKSVRVNPVTYHKTHRVLHKQTYATVTRTKLCCFGPHDWILEAQHTSLSS